MRNRLLLLVLFFSYSLPTGARPALAYHITDPSTISRYMKTVDIGVHIGLGCNRAIDQVSTGPVFSKIFLIYGQPLRLGNAYGASLYTDSFASTAEIQQAGLAFSYGFAGCAPLDPLGIPLAKITLSLSTTNYRGETTYEHGRAWASMLSSLDDQLRFYGLRRWIYPAGGNDMELDYNSPGATLAWIQGYEDNNVVELYDIGDAAGCPQSGTDTTDRLCNNGWRQSQVYTKSMPGSRYPFPQLYNTSGANALQWQQIGLWEYLNVSPDWSEPIWAGVLTQWRACQTNGPCSGTDNAPDSAWHQFINTLGSDARTYFYPGYLEYTTDISWVD